MANRLDEKINPGHVTIRSVLRIVGPILLLIGVAFGISGFSSVISSMGTFEQPTRFHHLFFAMPLTFFGLALTSAGFAGALARYQAQEIAPVGKDTFNYMADGTREGVTTIASAVAEGLRGASSTSSEKACPACATSNDTDARFCKACGATLPTARICAGCGTSNDEDARFCDSCGKPLD